MPLSTANSKRSIFSYTKVQQFIASLVRGHQSFIKKKRIQHKSLLNIGCGPFPKEEFINLDYNWNPDIDICWDIADKPYPFPDNSLEGIFTEHCLEHIPYDKCIENLKEFHRILKPGGTLRIIVPDGQIYFDLYQQKKTDKSVTLPYGDNEETPAISINRIFRSHGHLFIYDFETFSLNLQKVGFKNIIKESLQHGRDKRLLIDQSSRSVESLYVEATR
jgi:predicted SAM-dependent methyltransferase